MKSGAQELQLQAQLRQAMQTLWKRRWLAVFVAWAVAILAAPIVLLTPNRFEASAQIYVDTQTVLKPLMAGLAYTPDVDQQVRMLAKTLISRPNVEQLVAKPELGLEISSDPVQRERSISQVIERMKVTPVPATTNLYSITYRDTDAARAQRIVDSMLSLFVDAGSQGKRRDSQEASQFIDEQIKAYETKLVEAESRLKEFKMRNFGVSGVPEQDFYVRVAALSEEVGKLRVDLSSAEQARDSYRRELSGENPQLPVDATPAVPVPPTEIETRLETQKRLLDDLLRKYTEAHPDVIATRKLVAQLQDERRREIEEKAAAQAAARAKGLAATSPVYQRLRVALAEAEAQVASLRSQLILKEARLDQIRKAAGRAPQIEADLAQLNRDYDVINKNYQALVARRESASLGVKLDEGSRLADFRVVEPPRVSPSPVIPSRLHVAALATLLALLVGVGVPLLLEVLRPTFRDIAELNRATGRMVLGSISMAVTDEHRQHMRNQGIGVALACGGLFVLQAGWLVWLAAGHTTN